MATITTPEMKIPAGLSGIMSYAHVKIGRYPIQMKNPEHSCTVIVNEATDQYLAVALEVSDNLSNVCNKFLFHIQAIEASGILQRKLVYYKDEK